MAMIQGIRSFGHKLRRHVSSLMTPTMKSVLVLPDAEFCRLIEKTAIPPDTAGDTAAIIRHFGERPGDSWPDLAQPLRDLDFDLRDATREELLRRADAILEGRFTILNHNPLFTTDGAIDWSTNPTDDREWLWALHRHQWWVMLAAAYRETSDEKYAARILTELRSWVALYPPPSKIDEQSPAWRLMEVGLRLRESWLPTFGILCRASRSWSRDQLLMLRSIYDHASFIALFESHLAHRSYNHLLREANGLAYAGTFLPEFVEAARWRKTAFSRLARELAVQVNDDGSHIEVSTGYLWMVVDELEHALGLAKRGDPLLHNDLLRVLEAMYGVLAYVMRPDGTTPSLNDGDMEDRATQLGRLLRAGERYGRRDLTWVATQGEKGEAPATTSTAFADAGWFVMRSGWSCQEHYLLLDAGPYGGPHGHEDMLSIEVAAFGKPFLVDSGSYTYNRNDPRRNYFVGSQGHNTVLVDGMSQLRRWQRGSLSPKRGTKSAAGWETGARLDYVVGEYAGGYGFLRVNQPGEESQIKDVIHRRHVIFVKPDYWLLLDQLEASSPHSYQLLFHVAPDVGVSKAPGKRALLQCEEGCLAIVPAEPERLQLAVRSASENPAQAWYSPRYGSITPSNEVVYETCADAGVTVATLLWPTSDPRRLSEVDLRFESQPGALVATVKTAHGTDQITVYPNATLSRVALRRLDEEGREIEVR